eukprot:Blabericola_migrator_1__6252@NODE_3153_length_2001_cov_6_536711_g1975_i0_p1_GENE_NODE_3153_length_2001_cov_6_536711_g1975_i0NODE_3153_length_2001_cov_6_536711_g1975_i0_p1_ORF_typecomplete_len112_score19_97_NODE_3153_length_2001_cov_6_536711_g1975_i015501885
MKLLVTGVILSMCVAHIPIPKPLYQYVEPLNAVFTSMTNSDYQVFTPMTIPLLSLGASNVQGQLTTQDNDGEWLPTSVGRGSLRGQPASYQIRYSPYDASLDPNLVQLIVW